MHWCFTAPSSRYLDKPVLAGRHSAKTTSLHPPSHDAKASPLSRKRRLVSAKPHDQDLTVKKKENSEDHKKRM